MRHPRDMGAGKVEAFLSMLATERKVSASTHNHGAQCGAHSVARGALVSIGLHSLLPLRKQKNRLKGRSLLVVAKAAVVSNYLGNRRANVVDVFAV